MGARARPARHGSWAPGPCLLSEVSFGLNSLSAASGPAGLKKESEPQCWCWEGHGQQLEECCWATIHQKMSQWLKNDVKLVLFMFLASNQKHCCFKNYRWLLPTLILWHYLVLSIHFLLTSRYWSVWRSHFSHEDCVGPDEKTPGFKALIPKKYKRGRQR